MGALARTGDGRRNGTEAVGAELIQPLFSILATFLLFDEALFITGRYYLVDSGYSAQ